MRRLAPRAVGFRNLESDPSRLTDTFPSPPANTFVGSAYSTAGLADSVFVVFSILLLRRIIHKWTSSAEFPQGEISMHNLLIALAFIGMVVAPAIVAANSAQSPDEGE